MLSLGGVMSSPGVKAQPQPDTSLGAEASVVNAQGAHQDLVTGGASRGSSLFHSFETFNVGEGRSLYFANPIGIEQIFSRITGNSPSKIDGTLGVQGHWFRLMRCTKPLSSRDTAILPTTLKPRLEA